MGAAGPTGRSWFASSSAEGGLPGVSIAAAAAWETEDVRWVPAEEVGEHGDLHPGLQATWPTLSEAIGVREPR